MNSATPTREIFNVTLTALQRVGEADIRGHRDCVLKNLGLAPSSWSRRLAPINQLFRWLQQYHLIRKPHSMAS